MKNEITKERDNSTTKSFFKSQRNKFENRDDERQKKETKLFVSQQKKKLFKTEILKENINFVSLQT